MSTNVKPVATINGKKYPLVFGFKFLNEVNALKPDVEEVDSFVQLIGGLQDGDAFAFQKLMHAALITYDDLTTKEIDDYLETSDEALTLFENFISFLKQAPLTALRTKKALEAIKK
ncbi:TPA: tail assembly chaperone, partial [Enterococcus faecalis]